MKEPFRPFDPETMQADTYLGDELVDGENYHHRAVSVLTNVFNPLIEEFDQRARPLLTEDMLDSLPLTGGEPIKRKYTGDDSRGDHTYTYPLLKLPPFSEYIYSQQRTTRSDLSLYAPVGEYGAAFAAANVNAARALLTLQRQLLTRICQEMEAEYLIILGDETYQGDPFDTFREGIQTTCGTFGILTAQKVDGYEHDPLALSRQLVEDDIVNFFARNSTNGTVFPLMRDGIHFDNPIVPGRDQLSIKPEIRDAVIKTRQLAKRRAIAKARGRGCPVGYKTIQVDRPDGSSEKDSGINLMSRLYLDTVELFMQRENPVRNGQGFNLKNEIVSLYLDTPGENVDLSQETTNIPSFADIFPEIPYQTIG